MSDGVDILRAIAASLDLSSESTRWTPSRAADFDAGAWGAWECWEHAGIGRLPSGAIGAIATGDWIAWDSATGQQIGFPNCVGAEMFAVLQNEGRPTRVVALDGGFRQSEIDFATLAERVAEEQRRIAG